MKVWFPAVLFHMVHEVSSFISHYVAVHGLPQPAAPRGHNRPVPAFLPCSPKKKQVCEKYLKAGGKAAQHSSLWSQQCSEIVVMQPKEDVYGKCSDLLSQVYHALTEVKRLLSTESLRTQSLSRCLLLMQPT